MSVLSRVFTLAAVAALAAGLAQPAHADGAKPQAILIGGWHDRPGWGPPGHWRHWHGPPRHYGYYAPPPRVWYPPPRAYYPPPPPRYYAPPPGVGLYFRF
jgi:hypothetical protein